MNDEINYKNNPLNGVGLKKMLTQLTDHYGFDILFAYLNINCFRNNPSIASSVKFLKKTDWAREKVEGFYLYKFKSLPKASYEQAKLPPRDRIVPDGQVVGAPATLSLEEADQLREEREIKAAEFDSNAGSTRDKRNRSGKGGEASRNQNRESATVDEDESSSAVKRTASTADNPWGLVRPKRP